MMERLADGKMTTVCLTVMIITYFVWPLVAVKFVPQNFTLIINSSDVQGTLKHFWRSTGFCPPQPHQQAYKFDLSHDMILNLALIGAVPNNGIDQVRIHWLLDLVTVEKISKFPEGINIVYDFSKLDRLIWTLYRNGLKPGFELMGSPSNSFTDFENKTQVILWKDLVFQTAKRYIDFFGITYVRTWNFETWNEPDCKDFDNISVTIQGFLNYYDACSEGLLLASPDLILGGPGDGCDHVGHSKYSDAFLDHVVNGRNYFTGKKGIRLDFLSYHRKGNGKTNTIINGEVDIIDKISKKYPSLSSKPFYNDEGDPLVGWSKSKMWRADATYAAMVTKIIGQNILLKKNTKYHLTLLSNDNAFLSWYPYQFTERTLNARFQMNNTDPPHVQMVRKPVHSAMVLLSLLGETQLSASLTPTSHHRSVLNDDSSVGAIVSVHNPDFKNGRDSCQMTIVLYNSNDTQVSNSGKVKVDIQISGNFGVNFHGNTMVAGYKIDNDVATGNPYQIWKKDGEPKYPNFELLKCMHQREGPYRYMLSEFDWSSHISEYLHVSLPQPSVSVLHFCSKSPEPPGQVTSTTIYNITSGRILIAWSDHYVVTKCILTYEVEFSSHGVYGPYVRLNEYDIIVTAFTFTSIKRSDPLPSDNGVTGFYRIRAVDYWKRGGIYSTPVKYPT